MNTTAKAERYYQVMAVTLSRVTVQCFSEPEKARLCRNVLIAIGEKPMMSLDSVSIEETHAALRSRPEYANRSWEFVLPDGTVQTK